MSSYPNSRKACAYIQGKVVNIVPIDDPNYNDKYDSIYNHGYGEPAGTLGINCRH
ncbi:phage minor capsid protein, partial [Ligilactobacillus salivarius]